MATLLPQQGKAETLTPTAQLSQMCVYSGLLPCSESKAAGISQLHFVTSPARVIAQQNKMWSTFGVLCKQMENKAATG